MCVSVQASSCKSQAVARICGAAGAFHLGHRVMSSTPCKLDVGKWQGEMYSVLTVPSPFKFVKTGQTFAHMWAVEDYSTKQAIAFNYQVRLPTVPSMPVRYGPQQAVTWLSLPLISCHAAFLADHSFTNELKSSGHGNHLAASQSALAS